MGNKYSPDRWIIVKLGGKDPHFRIFASWYGGYLGADSWRMNSGITSLTEEDDYFLFGGSTGSTYFCHKNSYGLSGYGFSIVADFINVHKDQFQPLDEIDAIELIKKNDWIIA